MLSQSLPSAEGRMLLCVFTGTPGQVLGTRLVESLQARMQPSQTGTHADDTIHTPYELAEQTLTADPAQVGCWDGTIALFKVKPATAPSTSPKSHSSSSSGLQGMELLSHYSASTDAVRAVVWAPPGGEGAGGEEAGQWGSLFAVAGQAQQVTVWDAR